MGSICRNPVVLALPTSIVPEMLLSRYDWTIAVPATLI